ncbi:MAG: heavy-metal-associated domain-containing protein [Clostridiales bacterium]|nr:heavy-metal-associated domain-containing protein [Clostridiales bacterium]
MIKIVLSVDGMMCKMCEAHVNDAIKREFLNVKVSSSHQDKQTIIQTKTEIDKDELIKVVEKEGFKVLDIKVEEQKKKGIFGFLKKQG